MDTDAHSTAKRGKKYFGYKGHIGQDIDSGLIRKRDFTSAQPPDSQQKEALFSGDEQAVFGERAYSNQAEKRAARQMGVYYGMLDKGTRRRKLSKT
ncbi:MAG: transposase [Cytophagales bacterium]|nr:transposase [Cytophagales bacterium]